MSLVTAVIPAVTHFAPNGGCISAKDCPACGIHICCDSSGRAGTRQGDVRYVWGPCCCALNVCPECGHDRRPSVVIEGSGNA